jgi:hypothetical protein
MEHSMEQFLSISLIVFMSIFASLNLKIKVTKKIFYIYLCVAIFSFILGLAENIVFHEINNLKSGILIEYFSVDFKFFYASYFFIMLSVFGFILNYSKRK